VLQELVVERRVLSVEKQPVEAEQREHFGDLWVADRDPSPQRHLTLLEEVRKPTEHGRPP
jgi:hypothetical protein